MVIWTLCVFFLSVVMKVHSCEAGGLQGSCMTIDRSDPLGSDRCVGYIDHGDGSCGSADENYTYVCCVQVVCSSPEIGPGYCVGSLGFQSGVGSCGSTTDCPENFRISLREPFSSLECCNRVK
jgi:hypothetical protein